MLFVVASCSRDQSPARRPPESRTRTVRVAAAANLKYALENMLDEFARAHSDLELQLIYGSSGNFFAQLQQQAPYDIFLSADTTYPRQLVELQLASQDDYFLYAVGRLIILVSRDSTLNFEAHGIEALADATVRKIAIANPRLAPYGQAAEEALKNLGIYERVKDRLVLGDNVNQAAQFVDSGAADAGIVALSQAVVPPLRGKLHYWEIPPGAYQPIEQAAVIPNWSGNPEGARRLRSFLTGAEGQRLLQSFGYLSPAQQSSGE
jgi:molybdate transport system substrate-binding protein